ncbi:MAG: DNA-3-methyladenine glycosylase 2 family protein [Oscillospiraceae bacterium]|nr:DNA-3-methyladenine glycosylase 2 family protein [Oscillospiraceae bacterium]
MHYSDRGGEVEISAIADFNLEKTFECGQCFRWDADENGVYTGIALGRVARLRGEGSSIFISGTIEDFETVWRSYFDLDKDYLKIRQQLSIDPFMKEATQFGAGIRILRQDKWEALCSFIISQCNNIPRIKKIISILSMEFGDKINFDGLVFYSFPSAQRIAALCEADLAPLRCGYRAQYILSAARAVANKEIDLDSLAQATSEHARKKLKALHGVGDKVADCVLLFGLNKLDAFPIDVWMKRAMSEHYGKRFDPSIFSPYAGIAQQYIFHYTRNIQN